MISNTYMTVKNKNNVLRIQVRQNQTVSEHVLRPKQKFTIGRRLDNHLIVYNETFPKKHALIECGRETCTLNLNESMSGEIAFKESRILFKDLYIQELLPHKNDFHQLKFSHGRHGTIYIGDASVEFHFDGERHKEFAFPSYNWNTALKHTVFKDGLFKFLITVLVMCECYFFFWVKNYKFPPAAPPEVAEVQARLTKFVMTRAIQQPEKTLALRSGSGGTATDGSTEDQPSGGRKRQSSEEGGGTSPRPVGSQGLLGLIGGSGESAHTSSVVDFLVGEGLVQEMDQLMGRQTFAQNKGIGRNGGRGKGPGSGPGGGNDIDDLVNFGASGGIDDLISDVSGIGTVEMKKQGQVNIQTPGNVRGSQTAKGYRTVSSVMTVINNQYGRMMYTYNKYLKSDPELRGKVSVDITIESDGKVSNVQTVESSIANQDFVNELVRILRGLRFEQIPEGSVTVYVPLVFNRVG
jgi:TonB family protein